MKSGSSSTPNFWNLFKNVMLTATLNFLLLSFWHASTAKVAILLLILDETLMNFFKYIRSSFVEDKEAELILHHMDANNANLYNYIFLRKLNHAWEACADQGLQAVFLLIRPPSVVPSPSLRNVSSLFLRSKRKLSSRQLSPFPMVTITAR